jgi:predicted DNA-binding protein
MVHQQITLDTEQRERLRVLSERTRVPQSVFIREGIDAILELAENNGKLAKEVRVLIQRST